MVIASNNIENADASIGDVVDALYAMISGPKGVRNWDAYEYVYHPEVRLMRTGVNSAGEPWVKIMSRDSYQAEAGQYFETADFFEIEVARRIDIFGNIAHVWSAYEARTAIDDVTPERRGINSIQLYHGPDGHWRVISIIWDNERAGLSLPAFG